MKEMVKTLAHMDEYTQKHTQTHILVVSNQQKEDRTLSKNFTVVKDSGTIAGKSFKE